MMSGESYIWSVYTLQSTVGKRAKRMLNITVETTNDPRYGAVY